MANIPIDEAPNLNLDMENFTDKTPVHFDEMNGRHKQHLNNEKALLYPTFDDSGTAAGISSFNDFLATVKNRMRLFDFFKNFKTGMQFVMHLGKSANNCTTTATGLYLDARQGKVLMDLYTKLNSDLTNVLILRGYASGNANNYSETGMYQIISSEGSTMLNLGFKGPCVFLVYATSNYVAQEQIYSDGSLKRFRNSAGEWSAWK